MANAPKTETPPAKPVRRKAGGRPAVRAVPAALAVGGSELAELLHTTPQVVSGLARRGVLKQQKAGGYRLRENCRLYCAHLQDRALGDDDETEGRRLKLDLMRQKLAEWRRGHDALLTASIVRAIGTGLDRLAARLKGLPEAVSAIQEMSAGLSAARDRAEAGDEEEDVDGDQPDV